MRRDPWLAVLTLTLFVLLLSLMVPLQWLSRQADMPALRPAAGIIFVEGLLVIAAVGLAYYTFTHWLPAPKLMQSVVGVTFVAVLAVAVFCAERFFASPEPRSLAATTSPAAGKPYKPVVWTQFSVGEPVYVIARALIDEKAECPSISVDGTVSAMRERPDPRSATFGRLCERRILWRSKDLKIEMSSGKDVLLSQTVKHDPKTMTVMGDTGCRVASHEDQKCFSEADWPFGVIADSAGRVTSDLLIHVGDYFYREAACKRSSPACHHRAFGDRQESWWTDFFEPARELLPKAPWIFVRGNHEDCKRGGFGWFYYFGSNGEPCEAIHETTYLPFPDVLVLHFDTSHADDEYAYEVVQPKWQGLADEIKAMTALPGGNTPVLLLTHKPAYALCNDKAMPSSGCDSKRSNAITVANLARVREIIGVVQATGRRTIVLGGDIHTFQVADVMPQPDSDKTVTQVIVGNGGSGLDSYQLSGSPPANTAFTFQDYRFDTPKDPQNPKKEEWTHAKLGAPLMAVAQVWRKFGFTRLAFGDRGSIDLAVYDIYGDPQFTCDLASVRKSAAAVVASAGATPAPSIQPSTPRCR
jgi:hypothetical protein